MEHNISLSNEELNLLIVGLYCTGESAYRFYTNDYMPWNEAKEIKEKLKIKLKSTLFNP